MRVIILADSDNKEPFVEPRQLYTVNGERIIDRIVRQVKACKKKSIYITSHDERFDIEGTKRYEHDNSWDGKKENGMWLDAFPLEIINDDTAILYGDCYYTDDAVRTIVGYKGIDNHFFCTEIDKYKSPYYFKQHDEPLGWYIGNAEAFKADVEALKKKQADAETIFHSWHLFRYINDMDIDVHSFPENGRGYTAINDGSCDVDNVEDVELIQRNGTLHRVRCIRPFYDIADRTDRLNGDEWEVPYVRMLELMGKNKARTVVCEYIGEVNGSSTEEGIGADTLREESEEE